MLRRRRDRTPEDPLAHVVPDAAPPRWRGAVRIALGHRQRFAEMLGLVDDGPLRDRLVTMGDRVDHGVLAMWDLVRQGAVAEQALSASAPEQAAARLKDARRAQADDPYDPELGRRVDALAAAHASAQRVWNTVEDLDDRLALVDVRLGALVATAAELAAGAAVTDGLDRAEHDLDLAVAELDATRAALASLRSDTGTSGT